MPHFRKIPGIDPAGFDERRNLQVVPVGVTSRIYLVAGGDLEVSVEDDSVARVTFDTSDNKKAHSSAGLTGWEKSQSLREIRIKGIGPGRTTKLHAKLNGADWTVPLNVSVVSDQSYRRVGATVSADARAAIQGACSLREAVILVAEDQMHSSIGLGKTNENGSSYSGGTAEDWCGDFIAWCWAQASQIRGENNPIRSTNHLRSTIKAIAWALQPDSPAQLLQYEGGDPYAGTKNTQEWRDVGYNGYYPEPGDVILFRNPGKNSFFHLGMVYSYDGGDLVAIEGNAGTPPIKTEALPNAGTMTSTKPKMYPYAYIHVLV